MRLRPLALLLVLAALSLIAAGCGDDDDDDSGSSDETTEETATEEEGATGEDGGEGASAVSMTEFSFDPADLTVSQGDSLEVTNDGAIPHNYTVDGEDRATADLESGQTETVTVDLEPGEYEVICTIGDHADQGMTGTLTVE